MDEGINSVPWDHVTLPTLWILRHGETEWSRSGQHTGLTDIPLTERGEDQARAAAPKLADVHFDLVLSSPLKRARTTAALAGFEHPEIEPNAVEWNYGDYEGVAGQDIRAQRPGWLIWNDGVPNGETLDEVGARADKVIARVLSPQTSGPMKGRVVDNALVVAHGHFLRILAARWLELSATNGRHFVLETAGIGQLGWDKKTPGIAKWNV